MSHAGLALLALQVHTREEHELARPDELEAHVGHARHLRQAEDPLQDALPQPLVALLSGEEPPVALDQHHSHRSEQQAHEDRAQGVEDR